MITELLVLFLTGILTFLLLFLQGIQVPLKYGFKWGLGNRDEPREPTVFMLRIGRTVNNQLQALAVAVPIMIAVLLFPAAQGTLTEVGAWMFLIGRIGFAICYLIGIPILRSVIWGVGMFGSLVMAYAVFIHLI